MKVAVLLFVRAPPLPASELLHKQRLTKNKFKITGALNYIHVTTAQIVGRDSSVCIATRYELDGPGIESRWGRIFRTLSDRSWGPLSLLYNGYRVSFPGVKRSGRGVNHPPHVAPRLRKE